VDLLDRLVVADLGLRPYAATCPPEPNSTSIPLPSGLNVMIPRGGFVPAFATKASTRGSSTARAFAHGSSGSIAASIAGRSTVRIGEMTEPRYSSIDGRPYSPALSR
jgi:hypothetical protein